MGVEFDLSDVDRFFEDGEREVARMCDTVGKEAIEYAKENGDYLDHTKHLRESNTHSADKNGLTLENTAEYASYVESKGYDVLGNAALYAEKRLNE